MFSLTITMAPMKAIGVALPAMLLVGSSLSAHAANASQPAAAADPHAHHRAMLEKKTPPKAERLEIALPDTELVNQDGERMRFKSEVVGDKIVVVDFVYTTCTTVCPVLSALFAQVQERLGDRLGPEVAMVSVTVDPTRDTPQRLKAYAARHQAGEGWLWLTGGKQDVDAVLEDLGAYTPNFADHPSMVLVGDGRTGRWTRLYGFPSPDLILAKVDELVLARQIDQAAVAAER